MAYSILLIDDEIVALNALKTRIPWHKYGVDNFPNIKPGDAVIQGHTHIPMHEERDGILCINPGSVSIPKAGSAHQCLIYEDGGFETVVLES